MPGANENRKTQQAVILAVLIAAHGGEVPAPELAKRALQYGTRVFELRRAGFPIRNRTEVVDGKRHSWYSLPIGAQPELAESECVAPSPEPELPLFPHLQPSRYVDPEEGGR